MHTTQIASKGVTKYTLLKLRVLEKKIEDGKIEHVNIEDVKMFKEKYLLKRKKDLKKKKNSRICCRSSDFFNCHKSYKIYQETL